MSVLYVGCARLPWLIGNEVGMLSLSINVQSIRSSRGQAGFCWHGWELGCACWGQQCHPAQGHPRDPVQGH